MKHLTLILLTVFVLSCNSNEKKYVLATAVDQDGLAESIKRGEDVYTDLCITCHLADGKGVPKSFPPLANSDYLKNNQAESIKGVKYGMKGEITVNGEKYNSIMAPLGLSDEEVADVMNYINNSWGNDFGKMITPQEVTKVIKK